ncbi:MAG: hypothetical protein IJ429_04685 [Lachnospiraceae bacterium]|nr:hypothetical protein [Lachnospiraceae bacterium]
MKKKLKIIVVILLVLIGLIGATIAAVHIAVHIYKQHRQDFEASVQELYGTENYLGPMKEKVQALTEKEVEEFKSEWEFSYFSHDIDKNYNQYEFDVNGRCNREKIENIYDARNTACALMKYLGIRCDADTFLYGKKLKRGESESCDTYMFYQYYKGICVNYGRVYVRVDDKGNTISATIRVEAQEDINIKSVKPKFTKEDVLAYMDKEYGYYEIEECRLCLDMNEKEWIKNDRIKWDLVWEVDVYSENSLVYCIVFDAYTGEEIDAQFACDA